MNLYGNIKLDLQMILILNSFSDMPECNSSIKAIGVFQRVQEKA